MLQTSTGVRRARAAAVLVAAVALSAITALAAEPAASRPPGQKWAVLVGIDDYTLAERLRYCAADQRALRERLLAAGFPEKQVFLLEDGAAESRYRPSKANIERQIESVLRLAEPGDFLLLGFSGHGTQIGKSMYLVPNDGDPEDAATLVTLDGVYERLQDCAASTKLVIVDARRNDPVRAGRRSVATAEGARALGRSLKEAPLPQGTVLINSCAPGEISWEEERFGHGVFMHYVLEGLAGRADADGDGRLSVSELARYAAHETKTYVIHEKNVTQHPYLRNEGEADLLDAALLPVAKRKAAVTSPEPRPAADPVKQEVAAIDGPARRPESPFKGRFHGPYVANSGPGGTYALEIDAEGRVSGTELWQGQTGKLWGSVGEDGAMKLLLEWPSYTYTVQGTIAKNANGHLAGTLVQHLGTRVMFSNRIDLSPR